MGYYAAGEYYMAGDVGAGGSGYDTSSSWLDQVAATFSHPFVQGAANALSGGNPVVQGVNAAMSLYQASRDPTMGYYQAGAGVHPAAATNPGANPNAYFTPGSGYNVPKSWSGGGRHYRRMNVTNVHALRRSMRRVKGFAKMAHSVMTFTKHHKMKVHRRRR
jgi:hypothetical protein